MPGNKTLRVQEIMRIQTRVRSKRRAEARAFRLVSSARFTVPAEFAKKSGSRGKKRERESKRRLVPSSATDAAAGPAARRMVILIERVITLIVGFRANKLRL